MVEEELIEAGFSKAEAEVYLCLIQHGPLKAGDISNKTGMYRPYVYDNLNNLMEMGLVSSFLSEGKKHFKAAKPSTIKDYLAQKLSRVEELVPQLEALMEPQAGDTLVEVYKGKNAIRKAMTDIIKILENDRKIVHLGMGIVEEAFLSAEPVFIRWFIRRLEKQNIKERMISYESERTFVGGRTTEYRFIPDQYFNPTQTLIDGELVTILFLTSNPKVAIKIKNAELADAYRKTFELMWGYGKKKRWKQTPTSKK